VKKTSRSDTCFEIHMATYANSEFSNAAKTLCAYNLDAGFSSARIYSERSLSTDFATMNAATLMHSRGAGYWIWKTYLLSDMIKSHSRDSTLLYLDAGVLPYGTAQYFLDLASDNLIHVWGVKNQCIENWCDPTVLTSIKFPREKYKSQLVMGGMILARNSSLLTQFTELWSEMCSNPKYLHPDSFPSYQKSEVLIWHRHDQALLSIIVALHPEWFFVHADSTSPNYYSSQFLIHRNGKRKYFTLGLRVHRWKYSFKFRIKRLLPVFIYKLVVQFLFIKKIRRRGQMSSAELKSVRKSL
jgi:hypothetical protein